MNKLQRAIRRELINIYLKVEYLTMDFDYVPFREDVYPSLRNIIGFVRDSENNIYKGLF